MVLRGAVSALVVAGFVVGVVAAGEASSTTDITLDARSVVYPVDDVARQIQTDCTGITDRVAIKIVTRHRSFGESFNCVDVNGHAASVVPQLLDLAARQPGVQRQANRVIAIDHALPPEQRAGYGPTPPDLAWYLASEAFGRCESADDLKQIRADLATSANRMPVAESPEQWTLIEAVWIAGVCPKQLQTLFRSVTRLGHPDAAAAVKRTIQQARESIK
jgi:hypothetical protein